MILLTGTSDLIQLVTAGTQTVNIHASWMDTSVGTQTPGRTNTIVNSATTTTLVGSPASFTERNVKTLIVTNTDVTAATITLQHFDGTTTVRIAPQIALPPGYTFMLEEDGWILVDTNGGRYEVPLSGRLLKTSVLTGGVTFTAGASTNSILHPHGGGRWGRSRVYFRRLGRVVRRWWGCGRVPREDRRGHSGHFVHLRDWGTRSGGVGSPRRHRRKHDFHRRGHYVHRLRRSGCGRSHCDGHGWDRVCWWGRRVGVYERGLEREWRPRR